MNDKANIRDRILDAAAEILESKGLKALNTNALAAWAGVTPPTVYRYFENKESVVAALADRFIEGERDWVTLAMADVRSNSSIEEAINVLIDAYWNSAKNLTGIVALRGAMRVWPELREIEEASLSNSTRLIADFLRPHLNAAEPKKLTRIARHIVENVCATIDRCYVSKPREQRWRIEELKKSIGLYAANRAQML